jgi:hypothetical protein
MKGRIERLSLGRYGGQIRAEDGNRFAFEASELLAYDAARLSVGQLVTFDIDPRKRRALRVSVEHERGLHHAAVKQHDTAQIRYVGFDQAESIRSYWFERTAPGQDTRRFVVTIDVGLFAKYHLRMQDGPALCLRILTADCGSQLLRHAVTDQDVLAFVVPPAETHVVRRFKRKPRQAPETGRMAAGAAGAGSIV